MSTIVKQFGKKLNILRVARGMTLQAFAHEMGYHGHGYISELETGKKAPSLEFVVRVSRLFDISTDMLLKDEIALPMMSYPSPSLPFVDRPPNATEVERLRLTLSTFQDGTGQQVMPDGSTVPGWRDFERSVALAFGGVAQESKAILDVLLPAKDGRLCGLSCKMRNLLNDVARTGRVSIELTNSSGKFWQALAVKGINQSNYRSRADETGETLLSLVRNWHQAVFNEQGGQVDLSKSYYLVLSWNNQGEYQLHQFTLTLPVVVAWEVVVGRTGKAHVVGRDENGRLFEWYGESGGQLKYYPPAETAIWRSEVFRLEPLPPANTPYGLASKMAAYFPEQWGKANQV